MTPQIRRFVFTLTAVVVGAVVYRTCRGTLPRLAAAAMERLSDAGLANPPSGPTSEIERLRGELAGTRRVTSATVRLTMSGKVWALQGNEITTLFRIIRELTVLEKGEDAECVLLPPFRDELTLLTADSSLPIQIEVTANRVLMKDRLSSQIYVVPEQHRGTLTTLMAPATVDKERRR
jgi:hypothetical protein